MNDRDSTLETPETLRAERDLAMALSAASGLQDALALVLETALSLSRMESGAVYFAGDGGALELRVRRGPEPHVPAQRLGDAGELARSIRRGQPIYLDGISGDPGAGELLGEGSRSGAVFPVLRNGWPLACVILSARQQTAIEAPARRTLERITSWLAPLETHLEAEQELRESRAALQTSERRIAMAINATSDAIWEWNILTGEAYYSPRWYEMLGYADRQFPMTFDTWRSLCHPDDVTPTVKLIEAALTDPHCSGYKAEFRMRRKDGAWIWVLGRGNVVGRDENGQPTMLSGTNTDISERKGREEELRRERAFSEALLDSLPGSFYLYDSNLRLRRWNRGFQVTSGRTAAELANHHLGDQANDDAERGRIQATARDVLTTGVPVTTETMVRSRDGRAVTYLSTGTRIETDEGPMLMGLSLDITQRKEAEAALRAEKDFSQTLLQRSPAFFVAIGRDGKTLLMNDTMLHALGYQAAEVEGRDYVQMFVPEADRAALATTFERIITRREVTVSTNRILARNGNELICEWRGVPVFRGSDYDFFFGLGIDITERVRAEKERHRLETQLAQSQKLEAVGRLAGGVAHDFNNMLSVILGYSEMILDEIDAHSPVREAALQIRQAAERSADLTRQLLAFARRQTAVPKVLDLNDTVETTLKMLRRLLGEDIEFVWKPGRDLWPIKIDPVQIEQVLTNLCINARDAIHGTGHITIETANASFDQAGLTPGDCVVLKVGDNGSGMPPEIRDHIFEPFFTTKRLGGGTGLGLATVHGIVHQNGGTIDVQSEPGKGSTFAIALPRAQALAQAAPPVAPSPDRWARGETVLLVEDDPALLDIGRRMLERLGFTVLAAATPGAAIASAAAYPGDILLLVSDMILPQMNGRDLLERLRAVRPGLRCLFVSGYTAEVIAHQDKLDEHVDFLAKPFSLQALSVKLAAVLGRPLDQG